MGWFLLHRATPEGGTLRVFGNQIIYKCLGFLKCLVKELLEDAVTGMVRRLLHQLALSHCSFFSREGRLFLTGDYCNLGLSLG